MQHHTPTPSRLHRRQTLVWGLAAALNLALASGSAQASDTVLVIGHPGLPKTDAATVARLYTGRAVELQGTTVQVVNAPSGSALRQRFLATYLQQDNEQYRAYWTVRRHIGKGVPPRELASSAEVLAFVQATPGAIGYIAADEARPGLNVILRP